MPVIAVRIPQIGEGLQEARLVGVLKQPGDAVKRDEPIYQMETDKAVMDVESPYEGTIVRWLAEVDAILPIGGAVAEMEVAEGTREMEVHGGAAEVAAPPAPTPAASAASSAPAPASQGNLAAIPPRTRAYAKEKSIAENVLLSIPAASGKLMPSDVDAFLANSGTTPGHTQLSPATSSKPASGSGIGGSFTDTPVSSKQRLVSSRLQRGNQLAVPGTIMVAVNWEPIERLKARMKADGGEFQPSAFTCFAYAVAKAIGEFPMFRSSLRGEEVLRTYDSVNLGIAVALPGDELVTAVVENAANLEWVDFATQSRAAIQSAREGKDQANESVTVSLTNMQSYGLRNAVPVVVPPSIATIFLGEVHNALDQESDELRLQRTVILSMTFDHRVINGAGASEFIKRVKENVETISKFVVLG